MYAYVASELAVVAEGDLAVRTAVLLGPKLSLRRRGRRRRREEVVVGEIQLLPSHVAAVCVGGRHDGPWERYWRRAGDGERCSHYRHLRLYRLRRRLDRLHRRLGLRGRPRSEQRRRRRAHFTRFEHGPRSCSSGTTPLDRCEPLTNPVTRLKWSPSPRRCRITCQGVNGGEGVVSIHKSQA